VDLDDFLQCRDDALLDGGLVGGRELSDEVVDEVDAVDLDGRVQVRCGDGFDERAEGHTRQLIVKDFRQREVAERGDGELDAEDGSAGGRVRSEGTRALTC
jgi:hypothetical protein